MIKPAFRDKALTLLQRYRDAGMTVTNNGLTIPFQEFDKKREDAIPTIKANLDCFLNKTLDFVTFKSENESLTRKYDYWGFKSFSGQGFLNQINKWSGGSAKVGDLLRDAFVRPGTPDEAAEKIEQVHKQLPVLITKPGLRLASIPTLVSYFWQIQNTRSIPVFYTSARKVLEENEAIRTDDLEGDPYAMYWLMNDELFALFSKEMDLTGVNPYWFVEHVLWLEYKSIILKPRIQAPALKDERQRPPKQQAAGYRDFIPPILQDFENLASGDSGDSNLFEKRVCVAFKMLGFLVDELGQGRGREPDGIAKWSEGGYGILFDAKSSSQPYAVGTADRAIIEYVGKYEPRLRKEGAKRLYFVIVSSRFRSDSDGALTNIRKESNARAVVLMTAEQLLRIIAKRIQEPFVFDMAAFEELLLDSGRLNDEKLEEFLKS